MIYFAYSITLINGRTGHGVIGMVMNVAFRITSVLVRCVHDPSIFVVSDIFLFTCFKSMNPGADRVNGR